MLKLENANELFISREGNHISLSIKYRDSDSADKALSLFIKKLKLKVNVDIDIDNHIESDNLHNQDYEDYTINIFKK